MKKLLAACAAVIIAAFGIGKLYCNQQENKMTDFSKTDPEFNELWRNFAQNEVKNHGSLDSKTAYLTILAAHVANQSVNEYKLILSEALDNGVSPTEAREALYQTVPYAGMSKAYDFFAAGSEVFAAKDIKLPLPNQSTTDKTNRLEKGIATQSEIFGGEHILAMRANAPAELKHIQDYLSANCFGDYYTRGGLSVKTREMVTLAVLIAMGGADPQAKAHVQANLNVGNSKQNMLDMVTQLLPYIGYPRTLNGIAAINEICNK